MEPEIKNEVREDVVVNNSKKKEFINLPAALIIVTIIIVGAFLTKSDSKSFFNKEPEQEKIGELVPVNDSEYIKGEKNSPITIVEYSDTDCPFCQKFHQTMGDLMIAYPGKIKWVYRHLPLENLHPEASKEAIASICVEKLGGQEKFWQYLDKMFVIESSKDNTQLLKLPIFAKELGINEDDFNNCIKSDEAKQKLEEYMSMGEKAQAKGTPFSFLVIEETGEIFPIFGAKSTEQMKEIIDSIIK